MSRGGRMEYGARPATAADFDAIAGLLCTVFGTRRDGATLRRAYAGPGGEPVGSAVLIAGRTLVGFLGQIPMRVRLGGRDALAAQGADFAILEPYRRLDAFLALVQTSVAELERAGVSLTFGVANAAATETLAGLLDCRPVAPVPVLARPLGGPFTARLLGAAGRLAAARTAPRNAARRVVRAARFDSRFDALWRRVADEYPVRVIRDAAFLNRRYVDGVESTYSRFVLEDAASAQPAGYLVTAVTGEGAARRGRICDLFVPRGEERHAVRPLLDAAFAEFRRRGARVADAWMFSHAHLRRPLRLAGFVPRRTLGGGLQAGILPAAAPGDADRVGRVSNWFLAMGDSDTV